MHTETPELKILYLNVTTQRGSAACGLHALANATALCAATELTAIKSDNMRSHLLNCFQRKYIYPFPGKKSTVANVTKFTESIVIHCHCQQLEHGKMIKYSKCNIWYLPPEMWNYHQLSLEKIAIMVLQKLQTVGIWSDHEHTVFVPAFQWFFCLLKNNLNARLNFVSVPSEVWPIIESPEQC